MNLFKKIEKLLSPAQSTSNRVMYIDIECNKCRERIRARVDLWNELTPDYDGMSDDPSSFHCRKVLVGENKCYQPIELELEFDRHHQLVKKEISGGKFVDQETRNR